jgi:hypothetical protein
MTLSVGILIIGSLFWDPDREPWRKSRLLMDQAMAVRAPIRYGRLSERRGHYTMVFSRLCKPGHAKLVPCRATADDIIDEAEHLWAAERNGPLNHRISANWGRVALLSHPDHDVPKAILSTWAVRVAQEPTYPDVPQAPGEDPLLSRSGILQIDWPRLGDPKKPAIDNLKLAPLDLLLATANHPTLVGQPPEYPDPATIASPWRGSAAGQVSPYFVNNRQSGILTFEDDAISSLLKSWTESRQLCCGFAPKAYSEREGRAAAQWGDADQHHQPESNHCASDRPRTFRAGRQRLSPSDAPERPCRGRQFSRPVRWPSAQWSHDPLAENRHRRRYQPPRIWPPVRRASVSTARCAER